MVWVMLKVKFSPAVIHLSNLSWMNLWNIIRCAFNNRKKSIKVLNNDKSKLWILRCKLEDNSKFNCIFFHFSLYYLFASFPALFTLLVFLRLNSLLLDILHSVLIRNWGCRWLLVKQHQITIFSMNTKQEEGTCSGSGWTLIQNLPLTKSYSPGWKRELFW